MSAASSPSSAPTIGASGRTGRKTSACATTRRLRRPSFAKSATRERSLPAIIVIPRRLGPLALRGQPPALRRRTLQRRHRRLRKRRAVSGASRGGQSAQDVARRDTRAFRPRRDRPLLARVDLQSALFAGRRNRAAPADLRRAHAAELPSLTARTRAGYERRALQRSSARLWAGDNSATPGRIGVLTYRDETDISLARALAPPFVHQPAPWRP